MFAIIINPVSGRANEQLAQRLTQLIEAKGETAKIFATECEGDATSKARQALAEGYTSIVGVGGDGTLSEIVEGIGGKDATLYIVPCGTGNDFARAFGLPKDPVEALRLHQAIWTCGVRAALAHGGVVNDHHGVGIKLGRLMKEQYGPAMQVFEGIKKHLDPNGIMNPFKLGL